MTLSSWVFSLLCLLFFVHCSEEASCHVKRLPVQWLTWKVSPLTIARRKLNTDGYQP